MRVGFPISTVVALCPDILPAALSNTGSGMAEASSQISNTFSLCTPARASGRSAEDVRADMKLLSGLAFSTIRSLKTSMLSFSMSGRALIHRFTSLNSASKSWPAVGAVSTDFCG